jgi:hypothetical protein
MEFRKKSNDWLKKNEVKEASSLTKNFNLSEMSIHDLSYE